MKRVAALALIAMLLLLIVPRSALADAPPPDITIDIKVVNTTGGLAYIDILVSKSLRYVALTEINPVTLDKYPDLKNSGLVDLDSDGYVSYSLYYADKHETRTFSMIPDNNGICFFNKGYDFSIFPIPAFKIASLDKTGKILKISTLIDISQYSPTTFKHPVITYDYSNNKAVINAETARVKNVSANTSNPFAYTLSMMLLLFYSAIRILCSTGIEVAIAVPFKIKPLKMVVWVNILTQILLTVGTYLLTANGILSYSLTIGFGDSCRWN